MVLPIAGTAGLLKGFIATKVIGSITNKVNEGNKGGAFFDKNDPEAMGKVSGTSVGGKSFGLKNPQSDGGDLLDVMKSIKSQGLKEKGKVVTNPVGSKLG